MKARIGACVTLLVLAVYGLRIPFLDDIDLRLLDAKFRLRGTVEPGGEIVLVGIDKKSLASVGRWPWPRTRVAALIEAISAGRPRAIALDLFFPEPSEDPRDDRALADALRKAGNVVLSFFFFRTADEARHQTGEDLARALPAIASARFDAVRVAGGSGKPPPLIGARGVEASVRGLADAAAGSGFCNVYLEREGTIRRVPLVIEAGGRCYAALSLAAARLLLGSPPLVLALDRGRVEAVAAGPRVVDTDSEGRMFLNYCADEKGFSYYSASAVLEGKIPPGALAGKLVFVGGVSIGDFETRPTPISPAMPSITIQANAALNILRGSYLREGYLSVCLTVAAVALLGFLIPLAFPLLPGALWRAGCAAACLAASLAGNYLLFSRLRIQTSALYPALSIALSYAAVSVWIASRQEQVLKRLREGITGVAEAIASTLDRDALYGKILDAILEFTGAESGILVVYARGEGGRDDPAVLENGVSRNMPGVQVGGTRFLPVSRMITEAETRRRTILLHRPSRHRRFKFDADPASAAVTFCMCVPLPGAGGPAGAIYVESRARHRRFPARDLGILDSFAAQCGLAIENARHFETIMRLEEKLQREEENLYPEPAAAAEASSREIIGTSAEIGKVFRLIEKMQDSDTTVLIGGETGTGKELVARAIHYGGKRARGPFVAQNCSALPEQLLESELFGHARGAFTGAVSDKKGLFEVADKGTIFLDEIGDTAPGMQAALLRVLQEGVIRPVGSSRETAVDVRVISATNRDLEKDVAEGRFREDLFYRLNVFPIRLPPLRERRGDIPLLADHFLKKYAGRGGKRMRGFTVEAMNLLVNYSFPGNIRELENEVEKAVALASEGEAIRADMLSPKIRGDLPMRELEEKVIEEGKSLKEVLKGIERGIISQVLRECGDNVAAAAEKLGIKRYSLYRKLEEFHLR